MAIAADLRTQATGIEIFRTPGLGDSSYLVVSGSEAAIVDPQRDGWRFVDAATRSGVRIRAVLETHVHNDYVSGALEIRAATAAEIVAPARGRYEFQHRRVEEGDFVEIGGHRLTCLETPGHTREHVAWQLTDIHAPGADPIAVFSGGSLLAGSVGRTDLAGASETAALTRAQYRSIRRLAALPGSVRLLPTHGGGSFCSGRPGVSGSEAGSTIELERAGNQLLQIDDLEVFSRNLLGNLSVVPGYSASIATINRTGPRLLGGPPSPAALTPADVARLSASGAWIVDTRDRMAFANAHVQGSINVEGSGSFASYVGSVVPFDAPIVLIVPGSSATVAADLALELARIGYEHVLGALHGGIERWVSVGRPVVQYPAFPVATLIAETPSPDAGPILDVRQPAEWRDGVIPGSTTISLADLPARVSEIAYSASRAGAQVTVVCQSGGRAAVAASLLERAGISVRLVASGGARDWLAGQDVH